jgi:hypothetical protein
LPAASNGKTPASSRHEAAPQSFRKLMLIQFHQRGIEFFGDAF